MEGEKIPMLEILFDLICNPRWVIPDLIFWLLERRMSGDESRMYPVEEEGPVTEEEKLRDRLEERTRCMNRRM